MKIDGKKVVIVLAIALLYIYALPLAVILTIAAFWRWFGSDWRRKWLWIVTVLLIMGVLRLVQLI